MSEDIIMRVIAQDMYSEELNKAKAAIDSMSAGELNQREATIKATDAAKDQSAAWSGFLTTAAEVVGATAAVAVGFKEVYDTAEQGAGIERIGSQWSATAQQFGVNGDSIVRSMQKVSDYTLTATQAEGAAAQAFTVGIAKNQQDITNFTEIARAMTVRFGGDTASNLDMVTRSIESGRAITLRAHGVTVDFTKAYKDLADQMGVHANDLTAEEKLQARANAVMEAGLVLVQKVGDTGKDAATKYEQLATAGNQVGEAFKSVVADALTPSVSTLALLATETQQLTSIEKDHEAQVRIIAANYKDYSTEIERSALLTGNLTPILDDNARAAAREAYDAGNAGGKYALLNDTIYEVSGGLTVLTATQYDSTRATREGSLSALEATNAQGGLQGTVERTAAALKEEAKAFDSDLKVNMALTAENTKFAEKQGDLIQKAADLRTKLEDLTNANGNVISTTKASTLTVDERAAAEGKLAAVEEDLTLRQRKKNETDLEFNARMQALAVTADNLRGKLDGVTKLKTVDNSKEITKTQTDLDKINQAIADNATAHELATHKIIYNQILQMDMLDGVLTPTEQASLQALGVAWGLTSNTVEAQTTAIIKANQDLAKDGSIDQFTRTVRVDSGEIVDSMSGAAKEAVILHNKIADLHDKQIHVTTYYEEKGSSQGSSSEARILHEKAITPKPVHVNPGAKGAAGLNMDVPPGFPNDSYPVYVTSGEHVAVTPEGKQAGNVTNIIINTNQPVSAQSIAILRSQAGAF